MQEVKVKCLGSLLTVLFFIPTLAICATPNAEFLELLGQFSALEELGVDVDQQIEANLPPIDDEVEQKRRDQLSAPIEESKP